MARVRMRAGGGLCIVLLAQASVLAGPVPAFAVRGRVFDMLGAPLKHAFVSQPGGGTFTSADGSYELRQATPGCRNITASGPSEPAGAYFETTRQICTLVGEANDEDFFVPFAVEGAASPMYRGDRGGPVTVSAAVYCAPGSCRLSADLYRIDFGAASNGLGDPAGSVPMAFSRITAEGFAEWRGVIADASMPQDGWYRVVVESRHPTTGDRQSRCPAERCELFFAVDTAAPRIDGPATMHVNVSDPALRIPVSDAGLGVDPSSVEATIDGEPVEAAYAGDPGSEFVEATSRSLSDGSHALVVAVADLAGNRRQARIEILVDREPPAVRDPEPTGSTDDRTPSISAFISDRGQSGIDASHIRMTLFYGPLSNRLRPVFDRSTGRITYDVPEIPTGAGIGEFPLPPGDYRVLLEIADRAGNAAARTWRFTVL